MRGSKGYLFLATTRPQRAPMLARWIQLDPSSRKATIERDKPLRTSCQRRVLTGQQCAYALRWLLICQAVCSKAEPPESPCKPPSGSARISETCSGPFPPPEPLVIAGV